MSLGKLYLFLKALQSRFLIEFKILKSERMKPGLQIIWSSGLYRGLGWGMVFDFDSVPWGHFREQEVFVFHFSFDTAVFFLFVFVFTLVSVFGFHITLGYILCGFVCFPWVGKIPWRRKWQPTPVFLTGESHGWRSLVGYSPQGCKELDTTEQPHFTLFVWKGKKAYCLSSKV